ncbi:MAG: EamA family transporter [Anaerolineales bacterium]|nr:EamA family transporter [Anaerolineae bacterium]PWB55786.1 MAG: EamA family transporter [Anaerolineales bacterium]
MSNKSPDRRTLVAFLLAVFFAGINGIAVRFSNAELPPFFGAGARFFLASVILFGIVLARRLPLPRGRSLFGVIIYGILGTGFNYAFLYWALEYLPAGLSVTILALTPLLTFLFAWAHRQEAFRWKVPIGSLLALAGILIITFNQLSTHTALLPILAVILAAACFAESTVIIKNYPQAHPVTTSAVSLLVGSILLLIFSAIWGEKLVLPTLLATWASFVYLIIFGSVITFILILYVIQHWTASASSYLFVLMPIVTITVGTWLAHESITLSLLLGGLLVLFGAYIGGIAKPEQLHLFYARLRTKFKPQVPECCPET